MSQEERKQKRKRTYQPISGFPEHLPEVRRVEQKLLDTIRRNYELAGFANIETPAVERTEVLTSKGADDKEIYTVGRLHDENEKAEDKLALHFDLTVPMARYVAQHYGQLTFPFRRYQIQKVWRGERAQSGRYREFYQADIDIIWDEKLPLSADTEVLTTINHVLSDLDIWKYTIRVNNRKIIIGFVQSLGIQDPKAIMNVITIIDKMPKIGEQEVRRLLDQIPLDSVSIDRAIEFCQVSMRGSEAVLAYLWAIDNDELQVGLKELQSVYRWALSLWVPEEKLVLDPAIARWLGYYTSTICETFLDGYERLGSICSGGRYDDLASYFTDKKLPGVGVSIGVSRLLSRLLQMERYNTGAQTPSQVLVTRLQDTYADIYAGIVRDLREAYVPTELYLDPEVKIGKQLGYAHKKWIPYAVVAGDEEIAQNQVQLKHMHTGDRENIPLDQIVDRVRQLIRSSWNE